MPSDKVSLSALLAAAYGPAQSFPDTLGFQVLAHVTIDGLRGIVRLSSGSLPRTCLLNSRPCSSRGSRKIAANLKAQLFVGLSFREQKCAKVLSVPPLEATPCALSVFRGGSWKWQPVVSSRRKDKRWPLPVTCCL